MGTALYILSSAPSYGGGESALTFATRSSQVPDGAATNQGGSVFALAPVNTNGAAKNIALAQGGTGGTSGSNVAPVVLAITAGLAAQRLSVSSLSLTYLQECAGTHGNMYVGYYAWVYRPSTGANVGVLWSGASDNPAYDSNSYVATNNSLYWRQFTAGSTRGEVNCLDGDRIVIEAWVHQITYGSEDGFTWGGNLAYPVNLLLSYFTYAPNIYPASFFDITMDGYPGGGLYWVGDRVPDPGLPTSFLEAIASREFKIMRWAEIEGIPYGYGMPSAQLAAFFDARVVEEQLLGIRSAMLGIPPIEDSALDTLEGVASKSGQVEIRLGDFDGAPTQWAGSGNLSGAYLSADIDEFDTSIVYTGDGSAIGSTGTLYIGKETMTFAAHNTGTKTISGITRGLYRSIAREFGAGYPIGIAPYTMLGRRVWYYMICVLPTVLTFEDSEPDKVLRFTGTLRNIKMASSPGEYVLSAESIERELSKDCFTNLRQVTDTLLAGIADAFGEGGSVSLPGTPGYSTDSFSSAEAASGFGVSSEEFALRIEDEIFLVEHLPSMAGFKINRRGLCGTKVAAHAPGWVGKEVVVITAAEAGSTAGYPDDADASFFSSSTTADSPAPSDNPLIILLHLLLSTSGGGNSVPGGRNYDHLPEGYGLGIDVERVDTESIERLSTKFLNVRAGGVIEQKTNFLDIAKSLLAPLGLYATSLLDGRFTIRELRPPYPDETPRTLDNSFRDRRAHPGYDFNLSSVVEAVEWQYAYDIKDKLYRRIQIQQILEALVYSGDGVRGNGRRLTYEMRLFYSGADGVVGEPLRAWKSDPEGLVFRRADFMRQRYARPAPVITERVDYSFIDIELGQLVAITATNLPNPLLGIRGLVAELAEVISKRPDEDEKTIDLECLLTGYQVTDYRFISPSLEIASAPTTSSFICTANAFTLDVPGQTDLEVIDSNGDVVPTFVAGQSVRIYSATFDAFEVATILSVDTSTRTVVLTGVPGTALAAGQFITFDEYSANSADDQAVYAWLADTDGKLDSGAVDGHRFFP